MSEPRRGYTQEFKREAVKLSRQAGYGVHRAAAELGIPWKTLRNWRSQQTPPRSCSPGDLAQAGEDPVALRARILELEKQLARVQLEKEILKKATAYFAKESL